MGNFLRKTKINELCGPQAHRPGITGIGSLVFRDEEGVLDRSGGDRKRIHDTIIALYKGELERWYTKHRNITSYFAIIFLTALSVIKPRSDAYKRVFNDLPPVPAELQPYL
jgi:lipopolysaccharide/colanic/teichoic acid biosynthesis glycosyltransferase